MLLPGKNTKRPFSLTKNLKTCFSCSPVYQLPDRESISEHSDTFAVYPSSPVRDLLYLSSFIPNMHIYLRLTLFCPKEVPTWLQGFYNSMVPGLKTQMQHNCVLTAEATAGGQSAVTTLWDHQQQFGDADLHLTPSGAS